MQQNIQASVSHFSSNFELDPNLSEEQADIIRLKNKINDPYSFY